MISAAFMAFWSLVSTCSLCSRDGDPYWKILLVREDQQQCITKLVLVKHSLQLLTCLDYTISVIAVDDEDDALCVLEVVAPQGSDLVLPTNIPNCELNVFVFDGLDVEA